MKYNFTTFDFYIIIVIYKKNKTMKKASILLLFVFSFINIHQSQAQTLEEKLSPLPEYLYHKFNKMILDGMCPWKYKKNPITKRITIYLEPPSTIKLIDLRIDGNPSCRIDSKCTTLIIPKNVQGRGYPMKLHCDLQENINDIERIRRLLIHLKNDINQYNTSFSIEI